MRMGAKAGKDEAILDLFKRIPLPLNFFFHLLPFIIHIIKKPAKGIGGHYDANNQLDIFIP
jgi:hypothetical protein